jgi:hypothetical protein
MSADELDRFTFVDVERSACLCDVGLIGYTAALCVTADGEDKAWLVNDAVLNVANAPHGSADHAHEQLGPLPAHWRHMVALAPYRCGRPRADGRPCRQAVRGPGRTCGWHSERTRAT